MSTLLIWFWVGNIVFIATALSFSQLGVSSYLDDKNWFWILYTYMVISSLFSGWLTSRLALKMLRTLAAR